MRRFTKASVILVLYFGFFPPGFGMANAEFPDLVTAVTSYWNLLTARDKYSALEFVAVESRNDFIQRREPSMRSWHLISIKPISELEAMVTVEVGRRMDSTPAFVKTRLTETWKRDEQGDWKVHVSRVTPRTLQSVYSPVWDRQAEPTGSLEILPSEPRIHFLSRNQQVVLVIRNGLEVPVRLVELDLDTDRFDVTERPEEVPSGERARIVVRYKGDETEKNLSSRILMTLQSGESQTSYEIPFVYNYVSPATRGLFGLSRQDAEKLQRGQSLRPSIKVEGAASEDAPAIPLPFPEMKPEDEGEETSETSDKAKPDQVN